MNFNEVKGKEAKDSITGLKGTITALCQYVDRPDLIRIEYLDKEGNNKEEWISESRIILL